jgi:16S rRNA (guanine527-N7)-methyltransferase
MMWRDQKKDVLQSVSHETLERLRFLTTLVEKWNRSINLVSRATEPEIWGRHVRDSAQIFLAPSTSSEVWLDIGSGGGFPGLVLAVMARDHAPQRRHVLVESDKRKATFLREATRLLQLDVTVRSERIEQLEPQHADVTTARAVAPLKVLMPWICRHTKPEGFALLLKGAEYRAEVIEASIDWQFEVNVSASSTNPDAAVLLVREPKRRPS